MNLNAFPQDHDPSNWPEWCRALAALEAFKNRRLYPRVRIRGPQLPDLTAVEVLNWG